MGSSKKETAANADNTDKESRNNFASCFLYPFYPC
jgi:hypothetical protein